MFTLRRKYSDYRKSGNYMKPKQKKGKGRENNP